MKRPFAASSFALLSMFALACAGPREAEPEGEAASDVASAVTAAPVDSYYVVLDGPAAVKRIPRGVDPRSAEAAAAARARLVEIEAEQAALEPALVERGAIVIARLSRLANVIQILADENMARRIGGLPGVRRVERVPLFERTLASAVPLVRAPALWSATPAIQGDGVTIGIIDSGVDYTHADFGGPGTSADYAANDPAIIEPDSFPTARVVGGWDFAGDAYNPSAGVANPKPDADPLDCVTMIGEDISGGHGTHVAGIAAGNGVLQDGTPFDGPYAASFDPGLFRVAAGVAPRASIYALKVFGCEGSTTLLGAALDRAADPDKDGSFDDRLDVVNGSLGSAYGLGSTTIGDVITELTGLGTLIVAAAGNEGGNFFVTASPATYPEVLSVAASADNPLVTLKVTAPPSAIAEYPAAEGYFTKFLAAPVAADLAVASPVVGCSPFTNAAEVAGKIALIRRGTCSFLDKLNNAAAAGAVGAVISDNEAATLPFQMGGAPPGSVAIPGVMVTQADGAALEAALANGSVSVTIDPERYTGPGAELLPNFTARGPSPIDGRLKPEITAPGVAIDSAGVGTGADPVPNQGTSMASPMIAGAAALVRQAQPGLSAYELKAALVGSTVPLFDFSGVPYSTSRMGGGRVDVARAAATLITAAADPLAGEIGVSFGSVVAHEPTSVKRTFVVANHGASAVTLDAKIAPTFTPPGVTITVTPESMEVPAGETVTFELTLALDPAVLGDPESDPGTPAMQGMQEPTPRHFLNEASGLVQLTQTGGGAQAVTLPYNGSVRAAVLRKGTSISVCAESTDGSAGPVEIALEGAGAHPNPVVTAFQLGALDDVNPASDTNIHVAMTDLRAVGVATDLATAPSFEEARVYFGIAVTGDWTTPARGPVSVVSIEINPDQKGGPEYELRAEARNPNRPFRDSLVTRVYDRDTGEALNRHPINILTPDVARTQPFHNSVIVLSALLSEIGVDPANPVFDWTADTERPDLVVQVEKAKGTFDAGKVLVDTARHGLDGAPVFVGAGPVLVDVSPEAFAAGTPLDVLLLHHTNVTDRWEVVSIVPLLPGNLSLVAEGPAEVAFGASAEVKLLVTNDGATPAQGVKVSGGVLGGKILGAVAGQGSCASSAVVDCSLGELAPGASATISVTVQGAGSGGPSLAATVTSDLACEPLTADNEAVITVIELPDDSDPEPEPDPEEEAESIVAVGGCACRTSAGPDAGDSGVGSRAAWLAGGLGLMGLLRSRRRRARQAARAD